MPTPTDPELYEKVKRKIREKSDVFPSAYASGMIVKEYKRLGGKYKGKKTKELNKAIEAVGGKVTTYRNLEENLQSRPTRGGAVYRNLEENLQKKRSADLRQAAANMGSGLQEKLAKHNIRQYGNAEGNRALGGSLQADHINELVNASYQKNRDAPSQIGDYHLDKELSTAKAKVYHDPITKKTIVANRGTQGTFQDWANNAAYALGGYDLTGRYKNALDTQKAAVAKYGSVDTNVGHSQSGIITRKMNDLGLTKEVINVNPASKGERQKENETIVRSSLDPVSIFQPNKAKRNVTLNTGYNLLKNHSADILGRLGTQRIGI